MSTYNQHTEKHLRGMSMWIDEFITITDKKRQNFLSRLQEYLTSIINRTYKNLYGVEFSYECVRLHIITLLT